jgi:Flp pilus assembly protein TadG
VRPDAPGSSTKRPPRARRRSERSRGAALVEFALVAGPLLLLVFGTIEFGFAFNDYQSLRHGVREAGRSAVVASYGDDADCDLTGVTTTDQNTRKLLCATKNQVGLGDQVRVKIALGPSGYQRGAPVVLCAQDQLRSITGMFTPALDGRALTTRVEMRIEKTTVEVVEAAEEHPLPGQSWNFCAVPDDPETPTPPEV